MTDTNPPTVDPHLPELADEYVLGLLDADEQARIEARMEHDAALRSAVGAARDRFLELDLVAPPAMPSSGLWSRIEAGLGQGAADADRPAAMANAANDNRVARWRAAALAGMAASLLLVAGLAWNLLDGPQPQVIAVLLNDAGEPLVLVEDFGNDTARITPLAGFEVPEGRTMQVWTLPSQEMGPVSLGLLAESETATLQGPDLPAPRDAQLYEITLEQAGGSPTGRPTGPILVKGFAKIPR